MFKPKYTSKSLIALIGVLLVLEMLFDPISVVGNFTVTQKAKSEFATAALRWETKGSENYKIKVRGWNLAECMYDVILTVRARRIVDIQAKDFLDENSTYATLEKAYWHGCDYDSLMIVEMLKSTERALDSTDPFRQRPHMSFDPEFGYVTHYNINYHRNGLFTQVRVSDCCTAFEFSDYEPIVLK